MTDAWLAKTVRDLLGCDPGMAHAVAGEMARSGMAFDVIENDPEAWAAFEALAREIHGRLEVSGLRERCHTLANSVSPLASLAHIVKAHVEAGRIDVEACPGLARALEAALSTAGTSATEGGDR